MDTAVQAEHDGSEFGDEEALEQETKTKRGRGLPDSCNDPSSPDFLVEKPQVWVRMRPACCDNNIFTISEDNKIMRIVVEPEDRIMQKKTGKTAIFQYCTDGILRDASQKETYKAIVHDLVQKALEGICGAVLCVGPEYSGKSHTLFGSLDKYPERGVVFRAIEELFEEAEAMRNEKEYHIVLSMFEVRKDKIKDLITLGDYDLRQVGEFGPKGLFYEEIFNMEQALMLILRGITGQKMLPREPWAKPHTVVYLDVICRHLQRGIIHTRDWRSRLTFVENAPLPHRERAKQTYNVVKPNSPLNSQQGGGWPGYTACPGSDPYMNNNPEDYPQQTSAIKQDEIISVKDVKGTCGCGKGGPPGPLAEAISIRKDFSFLEQMFVRAHDLRKIATYYAKLKSLGMYMLNQPPKLAPSQYFRQSRLAHCLKDIVTGKTEVRVILHIRPEKEFIQSSLEAMRFAERARCIPCEEKSPELEEEKTFEQQIALICKELGIENSSQVKGLKGIDPAGVAKMFPQLTSEKMKEIMGNATSHFENKLNTLEGVCKDQVKTMFETFRDIWMHLIDNTTSQLALPPKTEEPPPITPEPTQPEKQEALSEVPSGQKDGNKKKNQKEKGKENKKEKGKKRRSSQKLQNTKSRSDKRTDLESAGGASIIGIDEEDVPTSVPPPTPNSGIPRQSGESEKKGSQDSNRRSQRTSSRTSTTGKRNSNKSQKRSVTEPALDTINNNPEAQVQPEPLPVSAPEPLQTVQPTKLSRDETESTEVPTTAMITISPTEEASDGSEETHIHTAEVTADIKFKHEAWEGFKAEDVGGKMLAEFADLQTVFRQILLHHSEIQKSIGDITVKLTSNHVELDIVEQERSLAGVGVGVTLSGTALKPSTREEEIHAENESLEASRNELIGQLNEIRQQLQMNKQMIDEKKRQIEVVFYDYFMDKYNRFPRVTSLPLSTLHQVTTASALGALGFSLPVSEEEISRSAADKELRRSILEQVMNEKFGDIKRMAKQQAKEILSYYPKRPAWSNI